MLFLHHHGANISIADARSSGKSDKLSVVCNSEVVLEVGVSATCSGIPANASDIVCLITPSNRSSCFALRMQSITNSLRILSGCAESNSSAAWCLGLFISNVKYRLSRIVLSKQQLVPFSIGEAVKNCDRIHLAGVQTLAK
mgnify:CR=1 FL=1